MQLSITFYKGDRINISKNKLYKWVKVVNKRSKIEQFTKILEVNMIKRYDQKIYKLVIKI